MSKKCAKCEKTVYPAEELKCLDKAWHKNCFRCWECNMILTMKNYKGYNKLPYCNAHYPQTKHTVVADTPEQRRLKNITEMNSQVKYHEEFEKAKGSYTAVADDPETSRVRSVGGVISQHSYTGGSQAPAAYNSGMGNDDDDDDASHGGGYSRQNMPLPPAPGGGSSAGSGLVYSALYDYDAQDNDEVSFQENDRIINCEVIDEGWITGTVERTGQKGMIPANYVEPA